MIGKFLKFLSFSMCVFAIWFTGNGILLLRKYDALRAHTETSEIAWTSVENRSDSFLLKALYSYVVEEQTYQGSHLFFTPSFRNQYAIEEQIKEKPEKPLLVWYNPNDPAVSSLERKVPIKQFIYAFILWGLALYFWILKRRMKKGRK